MSKQMSYQGRVVDVVEVKGGWTTVLDGMKQLKVRNSELSAVKASEPPAQPGKVRSAKDKPAKAAKPAREPKARPEGAEDTRLVKADLTRYVVSDDVKTPSGRKAIDNDDDFARELRGSSLSEVFRIASQATGQTQKDLRAKYEHLNPGMQRMNLGNLIRGARRGAEREKTKEEKAAAKAAKKAAPAK